MAGPFAHLDEPRPARWPALLIGFAVAVPAVAVLAYFGLPALKSLFFGALAEFDDALGRRAERMRALCAEPVLPRDEGLCGCVLAAQAPALDCGARWNEWALTRHREQCAEPDRQRAAVAFCACVDALGAKLDGAVDDAERRGVSAGFERCARLDDALELPARLFDGVAEP